MRVDAQLDYLQDMDFARYKRFGGAIDFMVDGLYVTQDDVRYLRPDDVLNISIYRDYDPDSWGIRVVAKITTKSDISLSYSPKTM